MSKSKATIERERTERDEAREGMREWVKPGDTVWTVLRHTSSSGMSRSISVVIEGGSGPFDVTWRAACALGDRVDQRHGGIVMGGCGMDMGFALVYNLARTLWPEGFPCTGSSYRCPSNDHVNSGPDRNRYDVTVVHADGGYALRHEWL